MDQVKAKEILDKVVASIFGYQNPFTLEQAFNKFAFDIRLPQKVFDSKTNEECWATSLNPTSFMTMDNIKKQGAINDWVEPSVPLNSIDDVIQSWAKTRYMATSRQIESLNISESDTIYFSENVYRSSDLTASKNVLFCDGAKDLEYCVAVTRSQTSSYCLRLEDSQLCSNSFNVNWSGKITNSFFMQNSYDCMDCMFCSHMAGKRYCIANMQYSEEEYKRIKEIVIRWIFAS